MTAPGKLLPFARRPLVVDLFCGLGGWSEGFIAEGWRAVGFDIVRPDPSIGAYPGKLVLQDVATLDGSQFAAAACIVASPPCQGYSYRAMPFSRARALPPPDNSLFLAPWRIQREACRAAGRYIPLVVENVRGAQKWVGPARAKYGPFYLWGDVPALLPDGRGIFKAPGGGLRTRPTGELHEFWGGSPMRRHSSHSAARKRQSALIAKIPGELARFIARCYYPAGEGVPA